MIEVNEKKYEINIDTKLGTEKLMSKIMSNPDNPKNVGYMVIILRDILVPTPSNNELSDFRRSDREKVFQAFADKMNNANSDLKQKRSIL